MDITEALILLAHETPRKSTPASGQRLPHWTARIQIRIIVAEKALLENICSMRPSSMNPFQSALVYASSLLFFLFNYLLDALGLYQLRHQESTHTHTRTHTHTHTRTHTQIGGSGGQESACNAGDPGSIPGLVKDPLEKGMATHSNILAWRILWTEAPGGL